MEERKFEDINKILRDLQFPQLSEGTSTNEIIFKPFSPADTLESFFQKVSGEALTAFIPDTFTSILESVEITSEAAVTGQDTTRGLSLTRQEGSGFVLNFAIQWTNAWNIGDVIAIQNSYVAFTITPQSVSGVLGSKDISFNTTPLNLGFTAHIPSFLLKAELTTVDEEGEQTSNANHTQIADKYLGDLKKSSGDALIVRNIRFMAAPFLKNYSFYLDVENILDAGPLKVKRFQAEVNFKGGAGENDYEIAAWTTLELPPEYDPIDINLVAYRQKNAGTSIWEFKGSLAHSVKLGAIIEDISALFNTELTTLIPDVISKIEIKYLQLSIKTESKTVGAGKSGSSKDFNFEMGLELPIGDKLLDVTIFLTYEKKDSGAYEMEIRGSVMIAGRQFTIEFKKKSSSQTPGAPITDPLANASLLELKYASIDDKINLTELLADITDDPDITEALPEVSVKLDEVLFAVLKEGDTNKYLFGIELEVPIDLDFGKLPAVGGLLSSQGKFGIQSFKFFLASQPFYEEEVLFFPAEDQAFILGNLPTQQPLVAKPQPTVPPRVTVLTKGANFRAILNLGSMQKTIPPPPQNTLPSAAASTSTVTPTGASNGSTSGSTASPDKTKLPARKTSTAADGQASWMSIEKSLGPVTIARIGATYKDGNLWFFLSGSFHIASFAVSLDGLGIGAPIKDFSLDKIDVSLTGMGIDIQKGTLTIAGAFLRKHYELPAPYDEYNGIVQVAFPPFSLTGMGSYANYPDPDHPDQKHASLFLFVAIGFPITVHPSLIIEGMSLGFGIHRDFIAPAMSDILSFPLIQASVTPPPPMDIDKLVESLHQYFPPTVGQYFVVAGIKFKAFGLVDTLALLAVKFGREFEIDLIGVSSILLPGGFIELGWMARIIPDKGEFFIGGELTSRSFILIPSAQLTGGFAVAFWTEDTQKGDFVVSVGGYHPHFKRPDHYPDHISRLGISFKLGSTLTVKGGAYFAVTPQAIMMGGFLNATLKDGHLEGYLNMTLDAMIWYQPFHYDALIAVDAGVKVDIPAAFFTIHIHLHLHLDVHIWGPDFSGIAYLDVGPKTFSVPFGKGSSTKALPVGWEEFKGKFLQTKDKDGKLRDNVCSAVVTKGLIRKVKSSDTQDIYVVNPKELEIEAKTIVPITEKIDGTDNPETVGRFGITPMGIKSYKAHFTTTITKEVKVAHIETHSLTHTEITIETTNIEGKNVIEKRTIAFVEDKVTEETIIYKEFQPRNFFKNSSIFSSVPAAIWGGEGLTPPNLSKSDKPLLQNAMNGVLITPGADRESGGTHEMDKEQLAYNTDEFELKKAFGLRYSKSINQVLDLESPANKFYDFTGLTEAVAIEKDVLLHEPILVSLNN